MVYVWRCIYRRKEHVRQKEKEIRNKTPKYGCAKGQIYLSPDFDEPLDDFKEYM
jgi:hypothetical protein